MLRNLRNAIPEGFKNSQGDVLPNAVIVINGAEFEIETVKKTRVTIKRGKDEEYERDETELESVTPDMGGEIFYTADYWMQEQNFHRGNRGYPLDSESGEVVWEITLDEDWCEKFNSIEGTPTQKVTKLCEMHLLEVVLPDLKAAI